MLCTAICAFLGSSTAAPSCFSVIFLYLNDPKVIWDKIWKSKEFLFVPVHGTYCIDCIDVKNCWKKGNRPLMASTYQSGCQKICLPRSDARLVAENIWKLEFGIQHPTDQCAGSSLPGGLNQLFHHAEVMLFDLGFDFVKLRFSPPQQLRFCSNCKLSASSRDPKKLRGKEAIFFPTDLNAKDSASCIGGSKNNQQTHSILAGQVSHLVIGYRSEKKSFPWLSSRCLQVFGCCKML